MLKELIEKRNKLMHPNGSPENMVRVEPAPNQSREQEYLVGGPAIHDRLYSGALSSYIDSNN